jgi:hypothetical protein
MLIPGLRTRSRIRMDLNEIKLKDPDTRIEIQVLKISKKFGKKIYFNYLQKMNYFLTFSYFFAVSGE